MLSVTALTADGLMILSISRRSTLYRRHWVRPMVRFTVSRRRPRLGIVESGSCRDRLRRRPRAAGGGRCCRSARPLGRGHREHLPIGSPARARRRRSIESEMTLGPSSRPERPLDFARDKLRAERRDLFSTISSLLWREGPSTTPRCARLRSGRRICRKSSPEGFVR